MTVRLRAPTVADVAAHCAGEDDATVRWLTGGYGTFETTVAHFEVLARNAAAGRGKRGFGVWLDDRLCGYVDCDPDVRDGLDPGDVNISYAVHPWARGRGVAVDAVRQVCDFARSNDIGRRAAIRVEAANRASVRVAEKASFVHLRDFVSGTDRHDDGSPAVLSLYVRAL